MRATRLSPPPCRFAGSVDCAGPRGGLRLACWGRSRRHTGKVTSVRARAGARGPRGPRCGGLCAGRSPALPPSVSATSSSPASSSQRHRCGAPAAKSQPRPFPPAVGPRSLKAGTRMPSPWGACGPASTSRAVPKETLGSGPAHLGKLQTTSWGRGGGGPSAGRGRGCWCRRGAREAKPTFSFISVKINQIVRNGT